MFSPISIVPTPLSSNCSLYYSFRCFIFVLFKVGQTADRELKMLSTPIAFDPHRIGTILQLCILYLLLFVFSFSFFCLFCGSFAEVIAPRDRSCSRFASLEKCHHKNDAFRV
jgi:hypothetical protein